MTWNIQVPSHSHEVTPIALVLPVSTRLRALVSGPEYEAAVAAASVRFALRRRERESVAAPPAR